MFFVNLIHSQAVWLVEILHGNFDNFLWILSYSRSLEILLQNNLEVTFKIMKNTWKFYYKTWRNPGKVLEFCHFGKVETLPGSVVILRDHDHLKITKIRINVFVPKHL